MGLIFIFVGGAHFCVISLPSAAGAIYLIWSHKQGHRHATFWITVAATALFALCLRIYWLLLPNFQSGKVEVWPIIFKLLYNWPLFLTLIPVAVLVLAKRVFGKDSDLLVGIAAGLLFSVSLQFFAALFSGKFLTLLGLELVY